MVSFDRQDYVINHDDGRFWIRSRGAKVIKRLRQPLTTFKETETLKVALATPT